MWRFIQNTFSSFLGTLLALGILAFGGIFFLLVIGLLFQEPAPDMPDKAVLVVDLSMSINDKPPSVTLDSVLQEAPLQEEPQPPFVPTCHNQRYSDEDPLVD